MNIHRSCPTTHGSSDVVFYYTGVSSLSLYKSGKRAEISPCGKVGGKLVEKAGIDMDIPVEKDGITYDADEENKTIHFPQLTQGYPLLFRCFPTVIHVSA